MVCDISATSAYEALLEGRLAEAEARVFAEHLRSGCEACGAELSSVDPDELLFLVRGVWSDVGTDATAPVYDEARALAAVDEALPTGRVLQFRPRTALFAGGALAAAAALFLMVGPSSAPVAGPDLAPRGAGLPTLGESIDLSRWAAAGGAGAPVFEGDEVKAGARLAVGWTNPRREGKAWRQLSVVAQGEGGAWRSLGSHPIPVVEEDEEGPVVPADLEVEAGDTRICGVFTEAPVADLLERMKAERPPGPVVCTRVRVK